MNVLRTGVLMMGLIFSAVQSASGEPWKTGTPESVGLSAEKLEALRDLVGGRGCVVRRGTFVTSWGDVEKSADIASAMKPVLSTLLLLAIQEGRLKSVDEPVANVLPELGTLNGGKNADITWRHLASQTSSYGLAESPGTAWGYNDYALALYYDARTQKVFQAHGNDVLKTRLADVLGFEDAYTFEAFGANDRPGRLAVSVRDFARFGLLTLRNGVWNGKRVLRPDLLRLALSSPVPASMPLSSGIDADMLPNQRSIGGGKSITPIGPGIYSFNWWLNASDSAGRRLFPNAPPDTVVASGHGGVRALWVIPSLDLIVCWNDANVKDHDSSPGNPNTRMNQAATLMTEAVMDAERTTQLSLEGTRFMVNGTPTFLTGMSYYGALGGEPSDIEADLTELKRDGFNWIRVWATWGAFGNTVSAIDSDGYPREPFLSKLKWLVAKCDKMGMVVDVSFSRENGVSGPPRLRTMEGHRRAVETVITALKPHRNWYLDLSNERNIRDARHTPIAELAELREVARNLDPTLLVTASHAGDIPKEELRDYVETVKVDFITPHRPRHAASPAQTEEKTREYFAWMREIGRVVAVHYQEPFRRAFGWDPIASDYIADLRGAKAGGAAGWCLHNGDTRDATDGRPRRSFDLREGRLYDQMDAEEMAATKAVRNVGTRISLDGDRWAINGAVTYPNAPAEGLLMNVRMVNATFEDASPDARPPGHGEDDFDPDANTLEFLRRIPEYAAQGVRAFTLNLQGGFPGYEGAVNSAFTVDGTLRQPYLERVRKVVEACEAHGVAVILGCFYQRQDQVLRDADAMKAGVVHVCEWIRRCGFTNVLLEISNEFDHSGFDHDILRTAEGQVELMDLARQTVPTLLVSTSGLGHGRIPDVVAEASDFILIHFNGVPVREIPERIAALKGFRKPIVCNEDAKLGADAAEACRLSVENGASWGFMHERQNQHSPFRFEGAADDLSVYRMIEKCTRPVE